MRGPRPRRSIGVDPVGLGPREVGARVQAVAEREEGIAEGALVEGRRGRRVAIGAQGLRRRRPTDRAPGSQAAGRQEVVGAGDVGDERGRHGEQRRRREPVLCGTPRRLEHVASGSRPWRSWSAHQPSTHPGTGALRTSPRKGMDRWPFGAQGDGVAAACRRGRRRRARPAAPSGRWTSANRSPPMPHMCCVVTARTALVAMAASAADPPARSMATPAPEATWSTEHTIPPAACSVGDRGGHGISATYRRAGATTAASAVGEGVGGSPGRLDAVEAVGGRAPQPGGHAGGERVGEGEGADVAVERSGALGGDDEGRPRRGGRGATGGSR